MSLQLFARHIEDTMRRAGVKPVGVEGKQDGNWILLDFGDFIVHVFLDSARYYYDMDGMWREAPQLEIDEERGNAILAKLSQLSEDGVPSS